TGEIGKAVIERLRGFGCKVWAYSRSRSIEVNYVPFDELLQNSDIVTLHVPLNTDTHYIISHEQIQRMKPVSYTHLRA
ncbi:lactate dehydrogenase, partial [Enterococcus sp. S145_ASV_20]|nr:lactate dehydrogenase [Enterococcus sp. S145_ASV_20]